MNAGENSDSCMSKQEICPSSQHNPEGIRNLILLGDTAPFILSLLQPHKE